MNSLPICLKQNFYIITLYYIVTDGAVARWFKLLQDNISPVQLVDLSHMNKHELPLPTPPPGFSTPVLTMVGDQDLVVDVEAARETAQHFGQAEAVELEGIAHDLMLVRPGINLSLSCGVQAYSYNDVHRRCWCMQQPHKLS